VIGMNMPRGGGLTDVELSYIEKGIHMEERVICLMTQAAVECTEPHFRSFFAHYAERSQERLADLNAMLANGGVFR